MEKRFFPNFDQPCTFPGRDYHNKNGPLWFSCSEVITTWFHWTQHFKFRCKIVSYSLTVEEETVMMTWNSENISRLNYVFSLENGLLMTFFNNLAKTKISLRTSASLVKVIEPIWSIKSDRVNLVARHRQVLFIELGTVQTGTG